MTEREKELLNLLDGIRQWYVCSSDGDAMPAELLAKLEAETLDEGASQ